MGKRWDASGVAYDVAMWRECLRVLKPGGHLLAFGGTRTYHRMACAIEDAGFDVRDSIHWVYGSGFPKSHNVSKAIDAAAGAVREVIGVHPNPAGNKAGGNSLKMSVDGMPHDAVLTAPSTDAAKQWDGWGTALKPSHEPIVMARKPLDGTVSENVLEYGTGGLNVDACRVAHSNAKDLEAHKKSVEAIKAKGGSMANSWKNSSDLANANDVNTAGRWPPNTIFSHSEDCDDAACTEDCPVRELDAQSGIRTSGKVTKTYSNEMQSSIALGDKRRNLDPSKVFSDSGGASRFFPVFRYEAKASKKDRGEGNTHPTVKPIALMRWLVKLVAPSGSIVFDPFTGSGSTGVAAKAEGCSFFGIEGEANFVEIAQGRLAK
jgi:site-specific DNA-methyltransferase (adenine-specific)